MDLMRYSDATTIRAATIDEAWASVYAAESDGGAGVIEVDGVDCYVEGDPPCDHRSGDGRRSPDEARLCWPGTVCPTCRRILGPDGYWVVRD